MGTKAKSLVSYIILSTLVILLFSLTVHAAGYREVRAEEILKKIENGEDVNYKDCRIVGDLNVSKIELKTIPNPSFYELVNQGPYNKEVFIDLGYSESLYVIESGITITNSIFENGFNFSKVLFNSSADFSYSTLNSTSDFSSSTFNSSADFTHSTFNSSADFTYSTFNSPVYFSGAKFNSLVYFSDAKFNSPAEFFLVEFNCPVYFSKATFNSSAKFLKATFRSSADFLQATFRSSADFPQATFRSSANFSSATFDGSTQITRATFNSPVYFSDAKFNNPVDFIWATFNSSVYFSDAKFNSSAEFSNAKFNSPVDFRGVTFNSSAIFVAPDTSENIFTDGKTCELFMKYYNKEVRYTDADNIYYNYRRSFQNSKSFTDISKWIDFLSLVISGYGTKLLYIIYWVVFFIISFAIIYKNPGISLVKGGNKKIHIRLYWRRPGIYRLSRDVNEKSIVSVWESLYFSINTFTGLGSADWHSRAKFRKVVTLEGFFGWIMLALFISTLMNLMIRS